MKHGRLFHFSALVLLFILAQPVFAESEKAQEEAGVSPPPAAGKARIEVLEPDHDFGAVRQGDVKSISHTWALKNIGEENLLLTKVKPSCGCTAAVASATEIAPGATATVQATLNPKGKFGSQSISVRVSTNDPTHSTQVLRLSGTILSGWRVLPVHLDFARVGKAETVTKEVTVSSQYMKDDKTYRITHLKTSGPDIAAVTEEAAPQEGVQEGKGFLEIRRKVKVTLDTGETEGDHSGTLWIATDDPGSPTHSVTIRWFVEGDLTFNPSKLFVSEVRGRRVARDLVLDSHSGRAFDVTAVEVTGNSGQSGDVEVQLKADVSNPTHKVYSVSPNIQSDKPTETRSGKIILKTNIPEQSEISVPYTAILRK